MNNITFIGMPGSGKSFFGRKLSHKLGYKLIELDDLLEKECNLPLQKILDQMGDNDFLKKQAEDVVTYTQDQDNLIISTGGSIVYSDSAMEHLKQISKIIYLETPLEIIQGRIMESSRGVVGLKNKTLEQLYNERVVLYERWASITINSDRNSEEVIEDMLSFVL